jgi:hypothetical protein
MFRGSSDISYLMDIVATDVSQPLAARFINLWLPTVKFPSLGGMIWSYSQSVSGSTPTIPLSVEHGTAHGSAFGHQPSANVVE